MYMGKAKFYQKYLLIYLSHETKKIMKMITRTFSKKNFFFSLISNKFNKLVERFIL